MHAPLSLRQALCLLALFMTSATGSAMPGTAPYRACLRALNYFGVSDHYQAVCTDALKTSGGAVDPEVEDGLRVLKDFQESVVSAASYGRFFSYSPEQLARSADNQVFLAYSAVLVRSSEAQPAQYAALKRSALRIIDSAFEKQQEKNPELTAYLQALMAATAQLHLIENDEKSAAVLLARLEKTCPTEAECLFPFASGLTLDRRTERNTMRRLATLLADQHGLGNWRTGAAAMALAQSIGGHPAERGTSRESVYGPFFEIWKKADLLAQHPATIVWFSEIAAYRFERGDYARADEVLSYVWERIHKGEFDPIEYRRAADLAINVKVCLRKYEESLKMHEQSRQYWKQHYKTTLWNK